MKNIFASIFSKKTNQVKENRPTLKANEGVPKFIIKESEPQKSDFEITEISLEEYKKFVCNERRKTPRKTNYH